MDFEFNIVLILFALIGVMIYLLSTIMIYEFHKKRNDKTPSFLLINWYIFKYVKRYKMITKDENRRVGALFYFWLFSVNITLFSIVLMILINIVVMKGA